jgi:metal-sulfur cluster biosynthetic enzyme
MTMMTAIARESEVWRVLDRVNDPELDEAITEMGFVDQVTVKGRDVAVEFRLPTYWCSPNFAYLMAEGVRREVSALPWVARVTVLLRDHMFCDKVNAGVNGGLSFAAAFGTGEDLGELRAKFEAKAFQRRQESVILRLRAMGFADAAIAAMTVAELDAVDFEGGEAAGQKPRYRELLVAKGLAARPWDLAFRTWDGAALTAEGLAGYLATLRQVRINMEFNGALCRGLKSTRYKQVEPGDDGPSLVDFILGRVPPRTTAI